MCPLCFEHNSWKKGIILFRSKWEKKKDKRKWKNIQRCCGCIWGTFGNKFLNETILMDVLKKIISKWFLRILHKIQNIFNFNNFYKKINFFKSSHIPLSLMNEWVEKFKNSQKIINFPLSILLRPSDRWMHVERWGNWLTSTQREEKNVNIGNLWTFCSSSSRRRKIRCSIKIVDRFIYYRHVRDVGTPIAIYFQTFGFIYPKQS